jgi:hypothetical protein
MSEKQQISNLAFFDQQLPMLQVVGFEIAGFKKTNVFKGLSAKSTHQQRRKTQPKGWDTM